MPSKQFRSVQFRYQRGEDTVKRMRKAFIEEVFLNGFHRVRICDISRRAKVTRGAFYNYWGSLQECLGDFLLIREGVEEEEPFEDQEKKALNSSLVVRKIRELLSIRLNKELQSHYLPLVLLQEKSLFNAELSRLLRSCLQQIRKEWSKLIQRDQKAGLVRRNIERETSAVCILNFISGIIQNMNHESENEELNGPLKKAMSSFLCFLFTEKHLNSYYPQQAKVGKNGLILKAQSSISQKTQKTQKKNKEKSA